MNPRAAGEPLAALLVVIALHGAILGLLWQQRLLPSPTEAATLFVNFIAPSPQERTEAPRRPAPRPAEPLRAPQVVAATPAMPAEPAAIPPPTPVAPAPPAPGPLRVEPVAMATELAVACPGRVPPAFPSQSRRLGEEGTVVLRVELDEAGHVAMARIQASSGHARLDEAALVAVKAWRCTPAQRDGHPARAIALQPFKFVLQGT